MNKWIKVLGWAFLVTFGGMLYLESQVKFPSRNAGTVFSSQLTFSSGFNVTGGTNYLHDTYRPSIIWSNDQSGFAFETYEDTNAALRFLNGDTTLDVLQLDGSGLSFQQLNIWTYGLQSAGNVCLVLDTTDTNKLLYGSSPYIHAQSFYAGGTEKITINSNQVTLLNSNIWSSLTNDGPSIIFITNNLAANGSIYLDVNGILWKRTNSTWIVQ